MEEQVYCYPNEVINQFGSKKILNYFNVTKKDKKILRELAVQKAEIANLQIHSNKIDLWKKLNSLKQTRPLIWINEIPWHEMNVDDELSLKTETAFAKFLETRIRRTIYCWKHIPVDMVVEPNIICYLVTNNTGFGLSEKVNIASTDINSDIVSREFSPQIQNEVDVEKIKDPKITYDKEKTDEKFLTMLDLFDGILNVEKKGIPGFWFSPWDELIRWWGVQEALTDLMLRPKFVHKVIGRLTDAYLGMLNQYENKNLLSLNNKNFRIGSGGLGYTDDLPQKDFNPEKVRTYDLWGCGAAQIFSDVSPDMHYEFTLQYEIKWMKKFGLNYYGCCEPLDRKIEMLKKVPRLKKISISPWTDIDKAIEEMKGEFVISWKPNPAIFTENSWHPEHLKMLLTKTIRKFKGCNVEIIMKDISTVKYEPRRLWDWAKIAMEVVEDSKIL